MRKMKLLLVHMPIASALFPNLGLERLAELLRAKHHSVDVLYGTFHFFPPVPDWLSQDGRAGLMFAPEYYDEDSTEWAREIEAQIPDGAMENLDPAEVDFIATGIQAATNCVESCMAHIGVSEYDAVGFSIGFDAQRLASAALAKRLKRANPQLRIIAGGTACDGVMGPATLEVFPEFDAAFSGEADDDIESVFLSLLDPNVSFPRTLSVRANKVGQAATSAVITTPKLSGLPIPNYDSFLEQWRVSQYPKNDAPTILYEASRGCWYGKKNHCVFCGIRNVTETYRMTPSDAVLNDLHVLDTKYQPKLIYLTDAIISRQAFKEIFPAIATWRKEKRFGASLFIETKSNLAPHEVALLADANVKCIQPGIESLVTSTLEKMNKGATAIQQIELLKWCATFQVHAVYSLILGMPGESADDRWDMAHLCSLLHHLPAPSQAGNLLLHRFSPHFKEPEKYGLVNVRPYRYQEVMYRTSNEVLMNLCYGLDFDMGNKATQTIDELYSKGAVWTAVREWNYAKRHKPRLIHSERGASGVIIRGDRSGVTVERFEGVAAYILSSTHRAVSLASLITGATPESRNDILAAVEDLEDRGIILRLDNRILNLATPARGRAVANRLLKARFSFIPISVA